MKKKDLIKTSVMAALVALSSNAYASDVQSAVADLALCARHIIDVNTSPAAVSSAANFLEQAQKANYDVTQVKNLTAACKSRANALGTKWWYRDRTKQEDALNVLPVSDKTKKILHEFISPTTICHQIGADAVAAIGAAVGVGVAVQACKSSNGQEWLEPISANLQGGQGAIFGVDVTCRMEVRKGHRARIPLLSGQIGHIDGTGVYDPKDGNTHRTGRGYGFFATGEYRDGTDVKGEDGFDRDKWSGAGFLLGVVGMDSQIALSLRLPVPSGKDVLYQLVTAGRALDPATEPQCPALKSVASGVLSATKWVEGHISESKSKTDDSSTASPANSAN